MRARMYFQNYTLQIRTCLNKCMRYSRVSSRNMYASWRSFDATGRFMPETGSSSLTLASLLTCCGSRALDWYWEPDIVLINTGRCAKNEVISMGHRGTLVFISRQENRCLHGKSKAFDPSSPHFHRECVVKGWSTLDCWYKAVAPQVAKLVCNLLNLGFFLWL